jgi:hypothetical protein
MSTTPMLLFRVSGLFEFSLVSYSSTSGCIFSWSLICFFKSAIGITRLVCSSYIREYLRNLDMKDVILNLSKKQSLIKKNSKYNLLLGWNICYSGIDGCTHPD